MQLKIKSKERFQDRKYITICVIVLGALIQRTGSAVDGLKKKIYGGNNNDSIDNKKQERDVNWRSEDARSEALRGS